MKDNAIDDGHGASVLDAVLERTEVATDHEEFNKILEEFKGLKKAAP